VRRPRFFKNCRATEKKKKAVTVALLNSRMGKKCGYGDNLFFAAKVTDTKKMYIKWHSKDRSQKMRTKHII
jgi:hypothetical protein